MRYGWVGRHAIRRIRFGDRELIYRRTDEMRNSTATISSIRLTNRVVLLQEWLLRELTALERKERERLGTGRTQLSR